MRCHTWRSVHGPSLALKTDETVLQLNSAHATQTEILAEIHERHGKQIHLNQLPNFNLAETNASVMAVIPLNEAIMLKETLL